MTVAASSPGYVWRNPSIIPGFGLSFGFCLFYLGLVVLLPLSALVWQAAAMSWADFAALALDKRTLSALRLSFGAAFAAALVNLLFGTIAAWALVRYRFPGRRLMDAIVDMPFALPTAVAGIALTTLYAPNGWIGGPLASLGLKVAYTPAGIVVALIFVGFPFVVRTLQPVLEELDREVEEASATLGATRVQTVFRVLLPGLAPAILTGFALAFARGIGEYGSVIFIAGNRPFVSEIAPLLIVIRLEEFNYPGATAIAAIMLAVSFTMLFIINLLQSWSRRRG